MDHSAPRLVRGTTATMLGASGVGKTSLLKKPRGVRSAPARYVATVPGGTPPPPADFYRLTSGGVLLDLPGIRSLDLLATDEAVNETFADIAELAEHAGSATASTTASPAARWRRPSRWVTWRSGD